MRTFLGSSPVPYNIAVIDQNRILTPEWQRYLMLLPSTLASIPNVYNRIFLSTQAASIAATDLSGGTLLPGDYRATWYARITRAATTSSSLTVQINWVDGTVACSYAGAAITGNTTATVQSGTFMFRCDSAATVTYQTTYGSVGATSMQYCLDLVLERLR